MNKFHRSLLIGAAVIGLSGAAFGAQPDTRGGPDRGAMDEPGGHGADGKGGERMKERMAKRQAELHDKLKLSPGQEQGWAAFVASMAPPAPQARPDRAQWEKLSAPERMERMHARMKDAEGRMAIRLVALKTFYAQLTPEQQKVFNENVGRGQRHHHGRR